ncbi:Amino acid kinase family protein [Klebsormidium nitens]|uniref:Isopentenyl phosphate kinase n=1 Tax=Klebsormidium nitens TaxID=105231 RepID=A0A0U9HSJ4_KLENI|nr:Amino acid kinase family protein [Klebsormidium nitens]|eukprot:GAQ81990.1 Amino acid kinase family protein [Klebsormidium nitens]
MAGGSDQAGPRVRCILKLGGAAITKKNEFETLHETVLTATIQHIVDSLRAGGNDKEADHIVIVHGAGSFGHFQASKYGVSKGGLGSTAHILQGFAETRVSVTKLNHEVVRRLCEGGVAACGLSPFAGGWTTHNRKLATSDVASVRKTLEAGLLPVLHGDAVLDSGQGCTILSGDVIVRKLAADLRPDFVVFLTNVAGVYDKPPSEDGARLIREIAVAGDGTWTITDPNDLAQGVQMAAAAHDTTGGMATKIEEAAEIAAKGIPVYIAKAGTPAASAAIRGTPHKSLMGRKEGDSSRTSLEPWTGTVLRPSGH